MATPFLIFTLMAFSSSVYFNEVSALDIQPDHFSEIFPEDIHMSCSASSLEDEALEVLLMEIGRKGELPLAEIRPNSTATTHGTHPELRAEGRIDKNVGLSFLNVTLVKPTEASADDYTCQIYYKDESMQLVYQTSEATLSVTKTEQVLKKLVRELTPALQSLVNENNKQSEKVASLEERMSAMEKAMRVTPPTPAPTKPTTEDCFRNIFGNCIFG